VNFIPRPYQTEAVESAFGVWNRGVLSCLVEVPTGGGKTFLAAECIRRSMVDGKRALFIAHRLSLVKQGAREIGRFLNRQVGVWSGEEQSALHAPILSASKDSLHPKNLDQLDPKDFSILVCDEAHHACNGNMSYRRVFDWAREGGVRTLGITATPDRSDGVTLIGEGKPFAELAYRYPIWDCEGGASAIEDGWLVGIRQEHLEVDGLDFTDLRKKHRWTDEDIEKVLANEQTQLEMASATFDHCEGRQTVVFCPTVAFAHKMAELIDRYAKRQVCVVIHGQHKQHPITPEIRRERDRQYKSGEMQFAVSVDALTEGWDAPKTGCVVIMRPVKSRLRFAQMVGRGTRLVLDLPPEQIAAMTAEERRAAIKASGKPDCLVLGFYSNIADLKLWVNATDIIGAGLPEAIRRRANKIKDGDTASRLMVAKSQIESEHTHAAWKAEHRRVLESERLAIFTPKAMVRKRTVNVYEADRFNLSSDGGAVAEANRYKTSKHVPSDHRPSVKQSNFALALGLPPSSCMGMTKRQVQGWIGNALSMGAKPNYGILNKVITYGNSWFFSEKGRERWDSEGMAS
jgi:superfamily II DNA or RNA helicase